MHVKVEAGQKRDLIKNLKVSDDIKKQISKNLNKEPEEIKARDKGSTLSETRKKVYRKYTKY